MAPVVTLSAAISAKPSTSGSKAVNPDLAAARAALKELNEKAKQVRELKKMLEGGKKSKSTVSSRSSTSGSSSSSASCSSPGRCKPSKSSSVKKYSNKPQDIVKNCPEIRKQYQAEAAWTAARKAGTKMSYGKFMAAFD